MGERTGPGSVRGGHHQPGDIRHHNPPGLQRGREGGGPLSLVKELTSHEGGYSLS